MCKQNFGWPEQLKTHIRTKHRAELLARAGNYKKEIRQEQEEEEAKKKQQPDEKSAARMKARLPGGISVQSIPVDQASERRVVDFQAKHPGLSISSKGLSISSRTQPTPSSVTKLTQLSRPSLISKAKVTQSPWANTISKEKVTQAILPEKTLSGPGQTSMPNISQPSFPQRISLANIPRSNLPNIPQRISMANIPQRISMPNISQSSLPRTITMAKVSELSLPKRISIGNVKQSQHQWPNTRNTNQARASWWGR